MDWVTLTRREVDRDALPEVCVHCGSKASARDNDDYSWHPPWVNWLYFAGFFPGAVAASFFHKKMRLSLPVCQRHRPHSTFRMLVMVLGWLLLPLLLGGLALGGTWLRQRFIPDPDPDWVPLIWGASIGAGLGFLIWIVCLISFNRGRKHLSVQEINDEGITLVGLDDLFVKAVRDSRPASGQRPSE